MEIDKEANGLHLNFFQCFHIAINSLRISEISHQEARGKVRNRTAFDTYWMRRKLEKSSKNSNQGRKEFNSGAKNEKNVQLRTDNERF